MKKRIDCSTITIRKEIENKWWFPKTLDGEITGGCYYMNGIIYLKTKGDLPSGLEETVVNIISHETLHKVIHLFVGWRESDLPDDFLKLMIERNISKLIYIDSSGLVLK